MVALPHQTKWQDNRMSTKQVTITVTQSIRQVDKSGKIKEKSLTTYEVMKPVESVKQVATQNTWVQWRRLTGAKDKRWLWKKWTLADLLVNELFHEVNLKVWLQGIHRLTELDCQVLSRSTVFLSMLNQAGSYLILHQIFLCYSSAVLLYLDRSKLVLEYDVVMCKYKLRKKTNRF